MLPILTIAAVSVIAAAIDAPDEETLMIRQIDEIWPNQTMLEELGETEQVVRALNSYVVTEYIDKMYKELPEHAGPGNAARMMMWLKVFGLREDHGLFYRWIRRNPGIPLFLLEMFLKEKDLKMDYGVLIDVCSRSYPSHIYDLLLISIDKHPELVEVLARNPCIPNYMVRSLARHEKIQVRVSVATRSDLDEETQNLLVNDNSYRVVEALSENRFISRKHLTRLSTYPSSRVRRRIASNPTVDLITLSAMYSRETEQIVLMDLMANPKTPVHWLHDKDEVFLYVAKVTKSPEKLEFLSRKDSEIVRFHVAENPNISSSTAQRLSLDPSLSVIQAIAFNPSTPLDILMDLSKHPSSKIREYVATNKSIPKSVLLELEKDSCAIVRYTALLQSRKMPL